jgi:aspartyl-tRNA(Asn)/glutamyl-tRNA(Gln) amidotransferase subunit C
MASKLTRAEVLRIAELARLELSDAEVNLFTKQLDDILGYAEQVQEVDTTGVSPTSHALAIDAVWREDVTRPSLTHDETLPNAPDADRTAGLFKVPKVL